PCRPFVAASSAAVLQPSSPKLYRLRTDQMVLTVLLDHMRAPAGHAPARKRRDKRARLEPQRLQDEGREKLDVGAQVASRFHLVEHLQNRLLRGARQIAQLAGLERPAPGAHLVADGAQPIG